MAKYNESAENYLETILMLSKKLPVVRSVDIATELGFKKSSVSVAMKNLKEKEHITVTDAGFIYLTDSGRQIAAVSRPWGLMLQWQKRMPARLSMLSVKRVSRPSKIISAK